mgnify:CR=1 FL=1
MSRCRFECSSHLADWSISQSNDLSGTSSNGLWARASWREAPNPKEIPECVPEFLRVEVQMALSILYDGNVYDDHVDKCPYRGSGNIKRLATSGRCSPIRCPPGDVRVDGGEDEVWK